jgi:hypothetical protein
MRTFFAPLRSHGFLSEAGARLNFSLHAGEATRHRVMSLITLIEERTEQKVDGWETQIKKPSRRWQSHTFGPLEFFRTPEKYFSRKKYFTKRSSPFGILSCSAQAAFPRSSLLFQQLLLSISFFPPFVLASRDTNEGMFYG